MNFLKADWRQFKEEIEAGIIVLSLPPSIAAEENFFRDLMLRAARRHIPAGRHCHCTPSLFAESAAFPAERDRGRHNKSQSQKTTQNSRYATSQLNSQLLNQTAKGKRIKLLYSPPDP